MEKRTENAVRDVRMSSVSDSESKESEDDFVYVQPEEMRGRFRSKADLYNYLTLQEQLFLPPYKETNMRKFRNS